MSEDEIPLAQALTEFAFGLERADVPTGAELMREARDALESRDRRIAALTAELTAVEQFAIIHANAAQFANARKLWEHVRDVCRRAIGPPASLTDRKVGLPTKLPK